MNKEMKKYQVFTPYSMVEKILDKLSYFGKNIIGKKIIDLSCGDGAFLCLALRRIIAACQLEKIDENKTKIICQNSIHGREIDKEVFNSCIKKLNKIWAEYFSSSISWPNVIMSDGLATINETYDYVVGNPPFISYAELNLEQREFCRNNFKSCQFGRFDYLFAFIEKSLSILNENGRCALIFPITIYLIKSSKLLIDLISPYVDEIVDLSNAKLFNGVMTNPCITYISKSKTDSFLFYDGKKTNRLLNACLLSHFGKKTVSSEKKNRLGDFYNIGCCIATLSNNVFVLSEDDIKQNNIEKGIIKEAFSPKNVRYSIKEKIIYPYKNESGSVITYSEKNIASRFPNTYKWLRDHKNILDKRKRSNNCNWYEYGRNQALKYMDQEKILIPFIVSNHFSPILLGKDQIPYAGIFITCRFPDTHPIEEVFNLLKNENMYNYIKCVGIKMNGNSYRFSPNDLKDFRY